MAEWMVGSMVIERVASSDIHAAGDSADSSDNETGDLKAESTAFSLVGWSVSATASQMVGSMVIERAAS